MGYNFDNVFLMSDFSVSISKWQFIFSEKRLAETGSENRGLPLHLFY
jgi:hypothetical protein